MVGDEGFCLPLPFFAAPAFFFLGGGIVGCGVQGRRLQKIEGYSITSREFCCKSGILVTFCTRVTCRRPSHHLDACLPPTPPLYISFICTPFIPSRNDHISIRSFHRHPGRGESTPRRSCGPAGTCARRWDHVPAPRRRTWTSNYGSWGDKCRHLQKLR